MTTGKHDTSGLRTHKVLAIFNCTFTDTFKMH